ncbi:hypothetical protein BDP27DRAFT_53805 [Rhodocollybia butyracea]|uniref:Uncharacterized protein n=1 Tax=Rhodocollybia butyracea TaxID=206335 RepID=A0A9P5PHH9_9AGAR|nr:hypothetical protein BDP27DRAFT_53805 [Rhodocollybia butyracea]
MTFTSSVEQHLTPPYGTKGFVNQTYRVDGTNWVLDVYGYRHANSNDVTLIIVHSETIHKSQYPETYESDLGDGRYSYSINYTNTINMIGPDGKNPVPFQTVYRETFVSYRIDSPDPTYLKFTQQQIRWENNSCGVDCVRCDYRNLEMFCYSLRRFGL